MSDYQWDLIRAALPSAQTGGISSKRGRSVRSPEQTILQHYSDTLSSRLAVEDRSELNQIREQYQAEARRLHEAEKNKAIERSSGQLAMLQSSIATRREATENIASTRRQRGRALDPEFNFDFIVLDQAGLILPVGDATVTAESIASWNNVAKVVSKFPSFSGNFLNEVAGVEFVFAWTNPDIHSVVLNVESYLAVNGFCTAGADGGFIANNSTLLDVVVFLQLFIDPNQPTFPPSQPGQNILAGEVFANGGGFFGLGEVRSLAVAGNYDVIYRNFIVPGNSVAVFRVTLSSSVTADGGGFAAADFASGAFRVMCPALFLAIV
jgi:hypothetical protein